MSKYFTRIATLSLLPTLSLLLCVAIQSTQAAERQPNIVLIFADDLGWKDVGYQSDGKFLTPNIDRLTKEGMVFTDAYAPAGNCAPSRACLLSGNYTPRHHLYAVGSTDRGPTALKRMIPVPNNNGLPSRFVTIAEALKEAGYATGHFGKWHLAGKNGSLPSEQGFDETFDSFGEGELKEGAPGNKKGPPEDPKGVFALTRKACDFIERNKDKPVFCYLPHHAIHGPLQLRPKTEQIIQKHSDGNGPSTAYLGCTYDMDASVGMLLTKLKDLNLQDNTLVIFTSDNGATKGSSQEPLRGNKGSYYEGGIREPFVARWPGVVKAGSKSSVPINLVDLFPTFLAAAGVEPAKSKVLDGESLLPLLKQEGSLNREAIFWHFPGYLDSAVTRGRDRVFRTRPVSVIRKGNWKLHLYHEEWQLDGGRKSIDSNNSVELYDMVNDIGERKNVAGKNTAKRDELVEDLLAWFETADALLPKERNTKYDPNAKPPVRKPKRKKK
jgi:arylsulfatase A-like enzyme